MSLHAVRYTGQHQHTLATGRPIAFGTELTVGDDGDIAETEAQRLIDAGYAVQPATETPNTPDSYEGNTVTELRTELERRGLDTTGNKPDLIERLQADDAKRANANQQTPTLEA